MIAPDASERAAGSGAPDRDGVGARVVGPPVQDAVRIRGIADEAPIVLWITDAAGACTYLNGAWYAYTGQSESEALGLGWLCAVHPEDKPEAERILLAANAARKPFRMEYRLRRADAFQPRSQWCRPCVLDYQRRRRAAIKAGTWRPRPRSRSSDYPDAGSRERARRLQIVRDMIRVVEQRMERQQARMAALRAEEAALGDGLRTKRQAAEEAAGLVLVPITTPGRVGIIDEPGRPPAADPMRPPLIQELRSRAAPGYIP